MATFGNIQLSNNNFYVEDIFIAKYDPNGNIIWVRKAGGSSYDEGNDIATDGAGNSYVTGPFRGTATFGNTQISSGGSSDIFIAKYDANGNLLWVRKAGGTGEDSGNDITIDNSGNCYMTGTFRSTATFGTTQIISSGAEDIFTAKYDANGNLLWVRKAGGTSNDFSNDISADNSENCYVTGTFKNTATFGTTQIISSGAEDIFTAKYDANGNLVWVNKTGATYSDFGYGISVDNSGNCYTTGSFGGTVSFGSIVLENGNGFITKISAVTGIEELSGEIPTQFSLAQNYPNPFNPSTMIRFALPKDAHVEIELYSIHGELMKKLVSEEKQAGNYEISLEIPSFASGIYFYRIVASPGDKSEPFVQTRKFILMK